MGPRVWPLLPATLTWSPTEMGEEDTESVPHNTTSSSTLLAMDAHAETGLLSRMECV